MFTSKEISDVFQYVLPIITSNKFRTRAWHLDAVTAYPLVVLRQAQDIRKYATPFSISNPKYHDIAWAWKVLNTCVIHTHTIVLREALNFYVWELLETIMAQKGTNTIISGNELPKPAIFPNILLIKQPLQNESIFRLSIPQFTIWDIITLIIERCRNIWKFWGSRYVFCVCWDQNF